MYFCSCIIQVNMTDEDYINEIKKKDKEGIKQLWAEHVQNKKGSSIFWKSGKLFEYGKINKNNEPIIGVNVFPSLPI